VHVGERLENARFTTSYIGRYTKRPVLAESRIKEYDGDAVTFEYHDKIEKTHKLISFGWLEFLIRLIRHIHDKHFRGIRYAGIYSNKTRKRDLETVSLILKVEAGKGREPLKWRMRRIKQNGGDPLLCSRCRNEMKLVKIVIRTRDGPLKEIAVES